MNKDQPQKQFVVQLSEQEIQMVIQSVIDDLGDVKSAHRWVRNKLHSVNHQILTEGFTQQSVQSRDEWAIIDRAKADGRFESEIEMLAVWGRLMRGSES